MERGRCDSMAIVGVIGLGNMGSVIATLISKQEKHSLLLANRTFEKAQKLAETLNGNAVTNQDVFKKADVIFLGVKPNQIEGILKEGQEALAHSDSKLLVSMAAGLTLEEISDMAPRHHRFIRMMPNTPLEVGEGVITYALGDTASPDDKFLFNSLLEKGGLLIELQESNLDAATAVAGCGPAFVYLFIESLADAGVKQGLTRNDALLLATQTVKGSALMVEETNAHPAFLKENVCSPGGSTIAGVASLEETGFRASVLSAVDRAKKRTEELGK